MSANPGKLADDRSSWGRGLAALIGDMAAETSVDRPRGQRRLPTASLQPNPRNPRRSFPNAELDELVASLRERGIIRAMIGWMMPRSRKEATSSSSSALGKLRRGLRGFGCNEAVGKRR